MAVKPCVLSRKIFQYFVVTLKVFGEAPERVICEVKEKHTLNKYMRKLLSSKAGGTFNLECPDYTYIVRKDAVEIVFKMKRGIYLVVNLTRVNGSRGMLFAGWGNYWKRLTNEEKQLPMVAKTCPVLCELLMGKDKNGIIEMELGTSPQDCEHGFGLEISIPDNRPLLLCLNEDVVKKAMILRNKMVIIYSELLKNPPFPNWESGLDDIWE